MRLLLIVSEWVVCLATWARFDSILDDLWVTSLTGRLILVRLTHLKTIFTLIIAISVLMSLALLFVFPGWFSTWQLGHNYSACIFLTWQHNVPQTNKQTNKQKTKTTTIRKHLLSFRLHLYGSIVQYSLCVFLWEPNAVTL